LRMTFDQLLQKNDISLEEMRTVMEVFKK